MPKKVASESTVKSKVIKKDIPIVDMSTSTGRLEALKHFIMDSTHTGNMDSLLSTTFPQSARGKYCLISAAFMPKQVRLNRYFSLWRM